MKWRGRSNKKFPIRAVLAATIPFGLVGVAWKAREMQRPVEVKLGPQPFASRLLFERMDVEANKHPYAREIDVTWSQPWPKASGLELSNAQSLQWKRGEQTLFYSSQQYGWVYSHVERSGLEVLAKSHLPNDPIKLPASVHAQLRARGWTLTEQYLP